MNQAKQYPKSNKNKDYLNFIKIARTGHYPLFFDQWLSESLIQKQNLSFKKAGHNVQHTFKQLERHSTIEKKKTALLGMDRISREEFIRSFFKIVEHETLKEVNTLQ